MKTDNALTKEIKEGLKRGTKVRFRWHGSTQLYIGRIEVHKHGELFFVNEHNYKDDILIHEAMRFYNSLMDFHHFDLFEIFSDTSKG